MLFKNYKDDDKCVECGKLLKDLESGVAVCKKCEYEAQLDFAKSSSWQHLCASIVCFFNFEFLGFMMEFVWSIEELFHFGDYGPEGGLTKTLEEEKSRSEQASQNNVEEIHRTKDDS